MFLSKSVWRTVQAWHSPCGDEDRSRVEWVESCPGNSLAPGKDILLGQGRKSAPARRQQASFSKVGRLCLFPTLAWLAGKGVGWGVKFMAVGWDLRGCLCREVQKPKEATLYLQPLRLLQEMCLGEASWKDSLVIR